VRETGMPTTHARSSFPILPSFTAPQEFMAVLIWAQGADCDCPASRYFKRLGERLVNQYLEVGESGGGEEGV